MIRNTKKSSKLHITVILLLMLSFIFSCTTTDDFVDMHEHVNEHSHYHPYRVDFKTFSRATAISSLKEYFDEHNLFAKNVTTDTLDYDDFIADQNSILQYPDNDSEFNYSFHLTPKFPSSSDEVYNLVIKRDSVSNDWHGTGYRLKKSVNGLTKYESIKELFTTNFSSITLQKGHWQGEWTEYTESHCTNTGSCARTGTCDQCSLCVTTTVGYTLTYIDLGDSTTGGGTPAHGDGSSPIQGGNGGTGAAGSDDDFAINDGIIDAGDDLNVGIDPEIIEDPRCDQVAQLVGNSYVKPKLDSLRQNLNMRTETGYSFESNLTGQYTSMYLDATENNGNTLNLPGIIDDTEGVAHVHVNNYNISSTHPQTGEAITVNIKPIKIQSPQDTSWLLSAVIASADINREARINELRIQKKFNIVVNYSGMYMIKYEGNIQMLPRNFNGRDTALVEQYKLAIEQDLEGGYLRFLKEELGINNIGLYQIKRNGDVFRISLDENNKTIKTKCHDN